MIGVAFCIATLLAAGVSATSHTGAAGQSHDGQPRALRLAVVGFSGNAAQAIEAAVSGTLAKDARIKIIEQAQLHPVLAALGYDGSINMTTDDARRTGASIGCDFFVAGKAEVIARSEREGESHQEAIIAVMIVDGRSGSLCVFDFINERAETTGQAIERARAVLAARASGYVNRLSDFRAAQAAVPRDSNVSSDERVEDIPAPDSPLAAGFKPPEFLNRVKPDYTPQADLADISATVEAQAVFKSDGRVGDIVITRWAGFGLDEAAMSAIRKLEFKPATRDGKPISVRATIRYNFRRINETTDERR
jgi:TonB family protein